MGAEVCTLANLSGALWVLRYLHQQTHKLQGTFWGFCKYICINKSVISKVLKSCFVQIYFLMDAEIFASAHLMMVRCCKICFIKLDVDLTLKGLLLQTFFFNF